MDRASVVFAIIFLGLPLVGMLAAVLLPGTNLALAWASLLLLVTGLAIGLGFVDPGPGTSQR